MNVDYSSLPLDQQQRVVRFNLIGLCAQVAGLAWSDRAVAKADPSALPRANTERELDALVDDAARELVSLLDGGQDPLVQAFTDAGKTLASAAKVLAAARVEGLQVPSSGSEAKDPATGG